MTGVERTLHGNVLRVKAEAIHFHAVPSPTGYETITLGPSLKQEARDEMLVLWS
jgi:hypothetical protein